MAREGDPKDKTPPSLQGIKILFRNRVMKSDWDKLRAKLKILYQEKGITRCELRLPGCMDTFGMSFHHRHKRVWYLKYPKLLGDFNQTVLTCAYCHDKAEASRGLTILLFNKLRNAEYNIQR